MNSLQCHSGHLSSYHPRATQTSRWEGTWENWQSRYTTCFSLQCLQKGSQWSCDMAPVLAKICFSLFQCNFIHCSPPKKYIYKKTFKENRSYCGKGPFSTLPIQMPAKPINIYLSNECYLPTMLMLC